MNISVNSAYIKGYSRKIEGDRKHMSKPKRVNAEDFKSVQARMTLEDYARVQSVAKSQGLSLSEYAVQKIMSGNSETTTDIDFNKMLSQKIDEERKRIADIQLKFLEDYDKTIEGICHRYFEDKLSKMTLFGILGLKAELKKNGPTVYEMPLFGKMLDAIKVNSLLIEVKKEDAAK